MACSLPASLRKRALTRASLIATALIASASVQAQDSNSYILATRRSGAIEIIDPTSLATIGRIHFDLPRKSVGLNGVSASADGKMLYVEGPLPGEPNGCCVLYSIDLATLQTRQVADIPGTASRAGFVTSDGITYAAAPRGTPRFPGRALDVYDARHGKVVDYLIPSSFGKGGQPNVIWMDGRFFFYATSQDGSAARLWSVSPDAASLGEGVSVEPFAKVPGCSAYVEAGLAGAADNLFLYEMFGWKLDRRTRCSGVPGGVWIVDPDTGQLLGHVAMDLYFSELVADREKGELYGISVGDPQWRGGIELVRINAQDGSILQSRVLESDYWRIAFAPLRTFPAADVRALTSVKK
jgi:hypothetical protein